MKAAALILVVLTQQGHIFGGRSLEVAVRWAAQAPRPASLWEWRLTIAGAELASGTLPLGEEEASLRLDMPVVRQRTTALLTWTLREVNGRAILDQGRTEVHLWPDNLLEGLADRTGGRAILVMDEPGELSETLQKAGLKVTVAPDEASLRFTQPAVVLVGPQRLQERPFAQRALVGLAESGSSVLILRQTGVAVLAGHPIVRRPAPQPLAWLGGHSLARALRPLEPALGPGDLWAVRLGADEPILEIAFWPPEGPADPPAPMDVLVAVKALGRGRLVLCQMELGSWRDDPRSQAFLASAIDYLLTRPEPTPPASRRPMPVVAPAARDPIIEIPQGANP